MVESLRGSEVDLDWMTAHEAAEGFPFDRAGLDAYDVLILSDIGTNTFLVPPDVWLRSKPVPNRLKLIRDWVMDGGNLLMVGGYFSFQGIDGRARWRRTPVEDVLPVRCLPYDDRVEIPEGASLQAERPDHPIMAGFPDGPWPVLLGVNEVETKEDATLIARLPDEQGGHPLIVTGEYGKGRSAVWTSDLGPHWLPQDFCDWPGYGVLWRNLLGWLAAR